MKSYIKDGVFGVGLDIELEKLKRSSENDGDGCILLCGDAQTLPFKDETFDMVVTTEVIEHVADHDGFLSEIWRVLRSDGHLVLSTPNELQASSLIRRGVERIRKKRYIDSMNHISKVTPMKLKVELKRVGFVVESLKYDAFNPYIFPPYFLIFREIELLNAVYRIMDRLTDFYFLKPITKWDIVVKARKVVR